MYIYTMMCINIHHIVYQWLSAWPELQAPFAALQRAATWATAAGAKGKAGGSQGKTQGFTVSAGEIPPEVKVRLTGPPQKKHEIRILETILVSSRV